MAAAVARSPNMQDRVVDTRTPSPSPSQGSSAGGDGKDVYKPDLSKEVAMLSTKLINAINYQTNLDDSLQQSRHELERAKEELKRVQAEKSSLDDAIAQGVWMKKSEVDVQIAKLRAELASEKERREQAEKIKRQTESEVSDLTSSLFEEANKMVAEARKDTEAAERRNSQLRGQLSDTDVLLVSQQEQLQDLKATMEALATSNAQAQHQRDSSLPSTPVRASHGTFEAESPAKPNGITEAEIVQPNHPLHFSQLLQPVLRTDVAAYAEFAELLASARKSAASGQNPHSRNVSGASASASQRDVSSTSTSSTNSTSTATATSTSSPNLPGSFSFSAGNSPSTSAFAQTPAPALKETKFYARLLKEDLDPTLRLDLAPGLSFLTRRSVQSALLNGTLVVEPFAPSSNWKLYAPVFPCTLCGEARKTEPYIRRHRFRTSDAEEAQRWPLCDFCLGRVRGAGDLVGFLRMVREGFVKVGDGEDGERGVWEEVVRLRERCFWARLGGGVVPASSVGGVAGLGIKGRSSLEAVEEGKSSLVGDGGRDDVFRVRAGSQASEDLTAAEIETLNDSEALMASAKELKRRTMLHLGESAAVVSAPLQDDAAQSNSQQEQIEASEQLQQEVEAAQNSQTERAISPSPTPSSENGLERMVSAEEEQDDDAPPPVPEHKEGVSAATMEEPRLSRPVEAESATNARSGSVTSVSSQWRLATPPPPNERRPSSVLARVRAMEGRK